MQTSPDEMIVPDKTNLKSDKYVKDWAGPAADNPPVPELATDIEEPKTESTSSTDNKSRHMKSQDYANLRNNHTEFWPL